MTSVPTTSVPTTVLIGWNQDWLTSLDAALPARSVVVLEERDLYEGKRIAERWAGHPVLQDVRLTGYQQSDCFQDEIDRLAGQAPVRAVLPGLEYAVEAAAAAADRLGLPGAGTTAAAVLRDKLRLRRVCAAAGLPVPRFTEVTSPAELARFAAGGPCVLKPSNRQASLGVLLLDAGDDAADAWHECIRADEGVQVSRRSIRSRYLAEERLIGPEYSVEALVEDGRVTFTNVTRKLTVPGRYPIEQGHLVPAPPAAGPDQLPALMADLVSAVGYRTGVLHAEWIVHGGQPVLVECAGRPAGDYIMDLIELVHGVDLYAATERILAGEPATSGRTRGVPTRSAAVRFLFPSRTGTVTGVAGADEAAAVPGVHRIPFVCAAGTAVPPTGSSWRRLAAVIAVGREAAAAEAAAARAVARITMTVG